ncbi:PAS domain S-box-containing protein [Methanococcoides vulcani]|uniref:histidine kinase n=1 Tax=Methanococcoides vulcani TaxID=1353158 RepID=A0A1H9Y2U4_9EURY|nr:PAS domain S-box protein [Methanococcoides vulcani]SES62979.1 PAS domain S-box-containing protein [Methanococcoides vulcani]
MTATADYVSIDDLVNKGEEKYRYLIENTNDIIYSINEEGVVLYISPQIKRYGIDPEEMVNNYFENYIHPEDREKEVADFKKGMREKKAFSTTFRLLDSEGNVHWVENYPHFQSDKEGNSPGIIGVIRDVTRYKIAEDELKKYRNRLEELVELRTSELEKANEQLKKDILERKRAEETLKQKEKHISRLFDVAPIGMGVTCDRKILDSNEEASHILGYLKEEIIGKDTRMFYPSDECYRIVGEEMEAVIREKRTRTTETRFRHKDGRIINISMKLALLDKEDPSRGIIYTLQDITEKNNYEKEIKEKEAKIRSVFLATPIGIGVVWDRAFRDVNDNMCELVGYSREEIVGVNSRFLYPDEEEYYRVGNILKGLVENKEPIQAQGKWIRKDGKKIDVAFTFALIDPKNPPSGITFTVEDITEKLLADEKICNLTQFQQTVIENADIWLDVLNKDAEVVIWNNAAEKISGYAREEIIGSTKIWDLLYPDEKYRNEVFAEAKAILEQGKRVAGLETTITRKDGEERIISWNSRNLVNENREVIGAIAIGNDITQRKEAEKVQRTYFHFLQELLDAIPLPVFYKNKDGMYLGCNKAFEDFIGIKREELVGRTVFELAPEDLAQQYYEKDNELFENGEIQVYESWTESITDGSRRRVMFNKSLFTDLNGEKAGLVGAIFDVTEIKETEEMLRKYAKQLENSNEFKGIFTDILSHDLLNHATVIDGYTHLLLIGEDDENKLQKLDRIDNTNQKLIEVIECVAAFAKLESTDEIDFEPVDITKILNDCRSHFEYQAAQKEMEIVLETKGRYDALVNPMIEEVFANLISNAVKYGPENENIKIDVKDQDEYWKVTVTDSGKGIADEDKSMIFDRFKRAVGDCKIKGSGLGLAIVRRIVDIHGGEVGVEDNPDGAGSVFWVTLKKA